MITTAEPTVGAVWVRLLLDSLSAVGFDARAYCERKQWDLDRLHDPQTRLPWTETVAVWQAAVHGNADPHLGLHAATTLPFRAESPFGYLVASSAVLLDGLRMMIRYQDLHFDGQALSLEDRGDQVALRVSLPQGYPSMFHQIEYICALLKRTCAWVVGPGFHLLGVRFRHAGPTHPVEHERIFECSVAFRQPENALLLERGMATRRSLYANPEVLHAVQAVAERRLGELRRPAWVVRVRKALEDRPAPTSRMETIARLLDVSPRTLQRRLAAEDSSFAKVLDESRRDRALVLIHRMDLPLRAIASELGFADSRVFARAFQRWAGSSPSAYRASVGREVPASTRRADDDT